MICQQFNQVGVQLFLPDLAGVIKFHNSLINAFEVLSLTGVSPISTRHL